jgi:hypothetical protein
MSSEPIIYINRRPFVLRELEFPLHNLAVYSDVTAERLNDMEDRIRV